MYSTSEDHLAALSAPLRTAFEAKGFERLTSVQQAVLECEPEGADLRITSQTGSGKTLAIGFAIRHAVEAMAAARAKGAAALVVAPTRELAQQTQAELQWLYRGLGVTVLAVTGGGGYRDELRALSRGPAVVVGTPGRLLDHLRRGALLTEAMRAVVLDEADRMLDMGFREDIEALLAQLPEQRRTHLVSATFPRGVQSLARAVQRDPQVVEGTRLGSANADIDHLVHLVEARDRLGAIINLLLAQPGEQALVFARTRADVAELAEALSQTGFAVGALSGELDQLARNRALAAFKARRWQVLVATDVAARGIDVQDIARVIHTAPPSDADTYTHRAGRTGRAGRKGISSLLVTPAQSAWVTRLLREAGVAHRVEPLPNAAALRLAADARLLSQLTRAAGETGVAAGDAADGPGEAPRERDRALATEVLASADPALAVARLLARIRASEIEPADVRSPAANKRASRAIEARDGGRRPGRDKQRASGEFVRFRVSWGRRHGAEPHRVLAMVCRRGRIAGREVGAIQVDATFSLVDIAAGVAERFARAARAPDPRDARVVIRPDRGPAQKPPHSPRHPRARDARPSHDL